MFVGPAKTRQFKPVELYIPGSKQPVTARDESTKRLYREEPEMWRIFRRLYEVPDLASSNRIQSRCQTGQGRVSIPDKDGMRCMCNEKLMRLIRDQAIIRPPKIFRVPNSQAKNVHPSWTKRAFKSFYSNQQLQFPIATVVVRWKQCHHLPNYDITGLRDTLSKCGEIVELKQMKPNVCVVTFKELSSACDVIQSRHIGEPINKLYCTWYHKAMENKFVYEDVKGISVKRNLFIQ